MEKKKLIKNCLLFEDAVETYPFKDKKNSDIAIIRHKSNGKWFAVIFNLDNKLYINLKCNSYDSMHLRDNYSFITPAWHMNKKHWNKIDVTVIDDDMLNDLISISYELTSSKKTR